MGMLATVINALALRTLWKGRRSTRVMTAISMPQVAEPYIRRRAIRHFEKGASIFAAGTSNPYSQPTRRHLRASRFTPS